MTDFPPPPPALTAQFAQQPELSWIGAMNGFPVFKTFTHRVRLVGIRWPDGYAPEGWTLTPGLYHRPDLRTAEGQRWQRQLNAVSFPRVAGLASVGGR